MKPASYSWNFRDFPKLNYLKLTVCTLHFFEVFSYHVLNMLNLLLIPRHHNLHHKLNGDMTDKLKTNHYYEPSLRNLNCETLVFNSFNSWNYKCPFWSLTVEKIVYICRLECCMILRISTASMPSWSHKLKQIQS